MKNKKSKKGEGNIVVLRTVKKKNKSLSKLLIFCVLSVIPCHITPNIRNHSKYVVWIRHLYSLWKTIGVVISPQQRIRADVERHIYKFV